MKVLYCYRFGILGGVCTQLINRLKVFEPSGDLDAEFVFTRDLGISRTFDGDPRVHFSPTEADLKRLAASGGFDAAVVIDSPEFFEPLSEVPQLPVVTEVHTTTEGGMRYLEERTWRTIGYIVPSEYLRWVLRERFGVDRDHPICVIPNTIDAELFPRTEVDPPGPRPVFAWVGKLDDHKNFRGFLELAARITRKGLEGEYWLIGGETAPPSRQAELIDHIDRLELHSRCRWFPRIEYRAMHRVYAAVRASGGAKIVTSINESFGMSVLEAVICGCPVLASRVGALPEIAPGHSYIRFYESGDLDQAAAGAVQLAQPDEGARVRAELDSDRTQLLSRYSREVAVPRYVETLRGLISGSIQSEPGSGASSGSVLPDAGAARVTAEPPPSPPRPAADRAEPRAADADGLAGRPKFQFTAAEIPDRPPRLPLRVATIMDEFTHACFKLECRLVAVTPKDWRRVLSVDPPDLLFVESAWRGNHGAWRNQVVQTRPVNEGPLLELVQWCKSRGIPTVFWNKEDPPNFERFIHAAALFEHVFTTDQNCIPAYRERLGHDRMHALPFAAQPAVHNPVNCREQRFGNVCFAGTYYAQRHRDRRGQLDLLLQPALQRGLTIFDRMHGTGMEDHYAYPPEYRSAIYGAVPYEEMVDAYRRFRIFLNVNSVTDSPTMFSRRVFEILACGTPVISTYALAIERLLGRDVVPMVTSAEEAADWMDKLLAQPELAEQMAHLGQRRIFTEHTYEHRLRTVLEKIGIPLQLPPPRVSVITCTNRPARLENIIANYERQAYPHKELVLVLNSDDFSLTRVRKRLASVPDARVFQLPEASTLGRCLNAAADEARCEYWSKFDDDDFYGQHYLSDMLMPFAYTDASIVGKGCCYAYLQETRCLALRNPEGEHRYTSELPGSAMIVDRKVFDQVRFPDQNREEDTQFLRECAKLGFKLYSADRFNYVAQRAKSADHHSGKTAEAEFLRNCRIVAHTDDYRSYVVV
ncbi:MAG: glycosyltransferase [Phycisphaerae bacterium]